MSPDPVDHALKDITDILKGALAAAGGFVVRSGARILFLLMAGNLYGAERFGMLAYAIAVVETLAAIAVFGQKRSLFALLDEEGADQNAIILNALAVTAILSAVFALLLYAVFWPLIDMPAGGPYRGFALVIPLIALSDVMLAATRHKRLMRYEVIARSIAEPWTLAALTLGFYWGGFLKAGLMAAYFGALVVAYMASAWGFGRVYNLRRVLGARPSWRVARRIVIVSSPTAVVDVMALVFRRVDIFFLWHFSSETVVGIYHAAQHIAQLAQKTRYLFDPILAPIVSQTIARQDLANAGRQLSQVSRWVMTIMLLQVMLLAFYGGEILALVGPGMGAGALLLVIMVGAEMIDGVLGAAELPILFRQPKLNLVISLSGLIVHVAGCALLVPLLGGPGAAMSLMISLTVLNGQRLAAAHGLFRITLLRVSFLRPVAAAALALAAYFAAGEFMALDRGYGIVAGVLVLVVVYAGTLWRLGISADDRALLGYLRKKPAG